MTDVAAFKSARVEMQQLARRGRPKGNDVLYGDYDRSIDDIAPGNDVLDGGAGNDVLFGGHLDDTLLGGAGDDTLVGDGGSDVMVGGAGDDRFVFHFPGRGDRIAGFDLGASALSGDRIDLRAIAANTTVVGDQAFEPDTGLGQLRFVDLANENTLIRGNTTTLPGYELEIEVLDGATRASDWIAAIDILL